MRRHFHAIRVSNAERFRRMDDRPLIVFLNHASWWDPLTCISLSGTLMRDQEHYAPMDAEMLAHYRFFRRLGLFPVEMNTAHGAAQFLRTADAIFTKCNTVLWVTPQGQFADVRARPTVLKPGLGALAARLAAGPRCATFLPLAIEYTYWNERLPEILLRVGEPVQVDAGARYTTDDWTEILGSALTTTQDELAELSLARDASPFTAIAAGGVGVGGMYALWQRLRANVGGQRYVAEHDRIKRVKQGMPRG
jgi:1-acyl-sn-glycerol-3-phosphate acyltransferase